MSLLVAKCSIGCALFAGLDGDVQGLVADLAAVHGLDGCHRAFGCGEIGEADAAAAGGAFLVQHLDADDGAMGSKPTGVRKMSLGSVVRLLSSLCHPLRKWAMP